MSDFESVDNDPSVEVEILDVVDKGTEFIVTAIVMVESDDAATDFNEDFYLSKIDNMVTYDTSQLKDALIGTEVCRIGEKVIIEMLKTDVYNELSSYLEEMKSVEKEASKEDTPSL